MTVETKDVKTLSVCEIPDLKELFIAVEVNGKFFKGYLEQKEKLY
jgi:hypothetical protein